MDKVQKCSSNGKPGYRWGQSGKCYTYDRNDDNKEQAAWLRAAADGLAANPGRDKDDVLRNSEELDD